MPDAVIVSTARTPLCKSWRGAFNMTHGATVGMTVNRFCSSGLQTIAIASQRIISGEGDIYAAGGVESISCVQNEMNTHMIAEPWIVMHKPELYWPMLQTAEYVAKTYQISRERQDEYGVRSQQRAAAARAAGKFDAE